MFLGNAPNTRPGDIPGLYSGLRMHRVTLSEGANYTTSFAQREDQLAEIILFKPWSDFHTMAVEDKTLAKGLIEDEACEGNYCRQTCGHRICSEIVICKESMRDDSFLNEPHLAASMSQLLRALHKIAKKLGRGLDVDVVQEVPAAAYSCGISHDVALKKPQLLLPEVCIEVKLPNVGHEIFFSTTPSPPESPEEVASQYMNCITSPSSWLRKAICQVVFAAMNTTKGWGCLYNHDTAVFFKVHPTHEQGLRWLGVSVSRIYKCDDSEVTTLHGLLALFRGMNEKNETDQLFELLKRVEVMKQGKESSSAEGDLGKLTIKEQSKKRDERAVRRTRRQEAGPPGQIYTKEDKMLPPKCRRHSDDWSWSTARLSSNEEQALNEAIRGGVVLLLTYSQMHRIFILQSLGQVGIGGNGYVLRARVRCVDVAIKMHHTGSDSAMIDLRQEIEVYKSLARDHGSVLGNAILRVLAVCENDEEGDVLVTEYVGYALQRSRAKDEHRLSIWRVNDVVLTNEDKASITRFAKESLMELHACGFAHNDVRYPNVRVEKVFDGWHAWWIDLGRASRSESEAMKCSEVASCSRMLYE